MKSFLAGGLILVAAGLGLAQEAEVAAICRQCEAARPSAESLAFYSLDWAANLAEAKKRAAREDRPILFLLVTNITAATDFFAGHC